MVAREESAYILSSKVSEWMRMITWCSQDALADLEWFRDTYRFVNAK